MRISSACILRATLSMSLGVIFCNSSALANNRDQYTEQAVVGGAKAAAGAGLIYYGAKVHPEIKSAKDALSKAEIQHSDAVALVTTEDRAERIQQAQKALEAAKEEVRETQGWRTGKDVVKGVIIGSEALKGKDGNIGSAYINLEIADAFIDTPDEKADANYRDAQRQLHESSALRTATPAEREAAIMRAQALLDESKRALKGANEAYAPKGGAKALRVLGVVGGTILLLDTAGQVVALLAGDPTLTPIGSWVSNRLAPNKLNESPRRGVEALDQVGGAFDPRR